MQQAELGDCDTHRDMQLEPGGGISAYVLLDPEKASPCLTQLGMASSVPAVLQPEEGARTPKGD